MSVTADASASGNKEYSRQRLMRLFDRLQGVHQELTVLQMGILLRVAEKPGIWMTTLGQDMNVSPAQLSEAVNRLCDTSHYDATGPDLILVKVDQRNYKERGLSLTIKGKQLIGEILNGA